MSRTLSLIAVGLVLSAAPCFAQEAYRFTALADAVRTDALVVKVAADGPAAKAGINVHDVVTARDSARADVMMTLGASPRNASLPYMGITFFEWVQIVPGGSASPDSEQTPASV